VTIAQFAQRNTFHRTLYFTLAVLSHLSELFALIRGQDAKRVAWVQDPKAPKLAPV